MRIWFFGTPHLARQVLAELLHSSGIDVAFVVTNPDKPIWRTQSLCPSPVKELATEEGKIVLQPEKIRGNKEFLRTIRSFECDYFIVVAYGKIMPSSLLKIPKKMCINIHGSILPKYRWASPIQSALLSGESETGVTIMQMSEGMDEGDILKVRYISIDADETSGSLFEKFAWISGPTLIETLHELEHGGITPLPQESEKATYCTKIEKEDGLIDFSKSARDIYHMWQAYTPWPGIYTMYEGKRLLVEKAQYTDESISLVWDIGTVIRLDDGRIGIVCSEWVLTLEQVKLEWKRSQSMRDFVNGNKIIGYRL